MEAAVVVAGRTRVERVGRGAAVGLDFRLRGNDADGNVILVAALRTITNREFFTVQLCVESTF